RVRGAGTTRVRAVFRHRNDDGIRPRAGRNRSACNGGSRTPKGGRRPRTRVGLRGPVHRLVHQRSRSRQASLYVRTSFAQPRETDATGFVEMSAVSNEGSAVRNWLIGFGLWI